MPDDDILFHYVPPVFPVTPVIKDLEKNRDLSKDKQQKEKGEGDGLEDTAEAFGHSIRKQKKKDKQVDDRIVKAWQEEEPFTSVEADRIKHSFKPSELYKAVKIAFGKALYHAEKAFEQFSHPEQESIKNILGDNAKNIFELEKNFHQVKDQLSREQLTEYEVFLNDFIHEYKKSKKEQQVHFDKKSYDQEEKEKQLEVILMTAKRMLEQCRKSSKHQP